MKAVLKLFLDTYGKQKVHLDKNNNYSDGKDFIDWYINESGYVTNIMKKVKMYACYTPKGEQLIYTLREIEQESKNVITRIASSLTWKECKKAGYTCEPVLVTVEKQ